jgi:hypothetical protein
VPDQPKRGTACDVLYQPTLTSTELTAQIRQCVIGYSFDTMNDRITADDFKKPSTYVAILPTIVVILWSFGLLGKIQSLIAKARSYSAVDVDEMLLKK